MTNLEKAITGRVRGRRNKQILSSPRGLRDSAMQNHNIQPGEEMYKLSKAKPITKGAESEKKKQREGCESGVLLAQAKWRVVYLLAVLGWDGAEQCQSLDGCKGAERVISRQGTAVLKRMDHSRAMVYTCFII